MPLDLPTLGFILIILGIVLIVASSFSSGSGKVAIVGFIGPVPIGFGNDPRLLQIALIAGAVIFIMILLFFFRS